MFDDGESPELEIIEVRKNPEPVKAQNEHTETNSQPVLITEEMPVKEMQTVEIMIESDE